MFGTMLKALVFSGITLLGDLLVIGFLANVKAPVWLISVVVFVFTCVMFMLHGRRGSSRQRRGGYAGDAAAGYFVGSSDGGTMVDIVAEITAVITAGTTTPAAAGSEAGAMAAEVVGETAAVEVGVAVS